jgi:hypothetical protein
MYPRLALQARWIISLAVLIAGLASAAMTKAAPPRLIQANATMQRLGAWRIDLSPTLGAAEAALGQPTSCHPISLEDGSVARWNTLGVRIVTATLGGIPAGENSCSYSDMPVSVVTVTGRGWLTSFGLRVGDPTSKLRRLYPEASFHAAAYGDASPRNSYWLVTRRTACLGDCGTTRFVTGPQLVAQTRAGRVVAFAFPVGAQGE